MGYRSVRWFPCAMSTLALVLCSASAQAAPSITIDGPTVGAVVLDSAAVTVSVSSAYVLTSVVATIGSATTNLVSASGSQGTAWTGTLDLSSQPAGPVTLTITATDVMGESTLATVAVVHSRTPTLAVETPRESVARPCLRVKVTCTSIDGQPCDLIEVRTPDLAKIVTSVAGTGPGPLLLDRNLSLSEWEGQHSKLFVIARNSAGVLSPLQELPFYVDSSPTLIPLDEVDGRILDFDDTRILFAGAAGVAVKDRAAKAVTILGGGSPLTGVLLANGGALWEGGEWKNGTLLGNDITKLRTAGTWATFLTGMGSSGWAGNVQRRDLVAGTTELVGTGYAPDIDESGGVVFLADEGSQEHVHHVDPAGADEIVFSQPELLPIYVGEPHIGGTAITWEVDAREDRGVYLRTAVGKEPESFGSMGKPWPPYLVRAGWFANVRTTNGQAAAWTRSPSGTHALAGVHTGVVGIAALETDGTIAYDVASDGKLSRYFGGAGASAPLPPVRIGAGFGRLVRRGAVWYQIVERVLYRVDTSVTTPLAACGDPDPSAAPDGGVGSSGASPAPGATPPVLESSPLGEDSGCTSSGRDPSSGWIVGALAAIGLVVSRKRRAT